jgi:4-amino-4-deoxy-L-arabinose transferase-like glycosyltransferase
VNNPGKNNLQAGASRERKFSAMYVLLIVALAAVLVRVVVLADLWQTLPFYRTTTTGFDQDTYNQWAQKIVAGDVLSRQIGPFYYTPLYPYLLVGVYALAGSGNVLAGIIFNAIFGVAAAVLTAEIARRLFGPLAGVAAGLLMAMNGSQISVEAMLLMDSLIPAFFAGAILLTMCVLGAGAAESDSSSRPGGKLWQWLACGTCLGLAILARGSNVVVAAGLLALLAIASRRRRNRRILTAAVVMAAVVGVFVAVPVVRNGVLFNRWVLTTNTWPVLYIGNVPGSPGILWTGQEFNEADARVKKSASEDAAWKAELAGAIGKDPGGFAMLQLRKTLLFFNAIDIPDNGNYYFVRRYVTTLRQLTFDPLALYVLGSLGAFLAWKTWRRQVVLYVFGATFAVSIIAAYVDGRYKLPFYMLLCVWGGSAAESLWRFLRQRKWLPLAASVAAACVLTLAYWPRGPIGWPDLYATLRPNEFPYNAQSLFRSGQKHQAYAMMEDAHELFPNDVTFVHTLASLDLEENRPQKALDRMEPILVRGLSDAVLARDLLEKRVIAYAMLKQSDRVRDAAVDLLRAFPDDKLGREVIAQFAVPASRPASRP